MTRRGYVIATCLAVMGTTLASLVPVPLRLIWNASASVPIGFYMIAPADRIEVPDLVAVLPPEPIADFMVHRGYIARDTVDDRNVDAEALLAHQSLAGRLQEDAAKDRLVGHLNLVD